MPEIPHEYVVRSPDNEATLCGAVYRHYGTRRVRAFGRSLQAVSLSGRRLEIWAMTTELRESRVINRMKIEDDLRRSPRPRPASVQYRIAPSTAVPQRDPPPRYRRKRGRPHRLSHRPIA